MKELAKPIITLLVTLLGGGGVLYFFNHSNGKPKKRNEKTKRNETVQEFVNVKDIKDKFLYTKDNKVIIYIKIDPIDTDLLSKKEEKSLTKILTAEISGNLERMFKFIAVSRPADISSVIEENQEILAITKDPIQKKLLREEISSLSDYSLNGEAAERQFFLMLWEDYEENIESELIKCGNDFISAFNSGNIKAEILKEKEIYQLCNLVNNPAYIDEDIDFNPTIPLLG